MGRSMVSRSAQRLGVHRRARRGTRHHALPPAPRMAGGLQWQARPDWRLGRHPGRDVAHGETGGALVRRRSIYRRTAVARGRDIGIYLTAASARQARAQARVLSAAVTAMEAHFGAYPYPSYAIVELPDSSVQWAASSEQGFIMATASTLAVPGGNLPLFAHEAAHGWWGNLVNSDGPGSLLVSESLAQYSAVLAVEAIEGAAAGRDFLRFSRPGYNPVQCALGYLHIWREGGDKPLAELSDGPWDHNLSDSKGMWFYHMLRHQVGDEVFFAVLRRQLREFAGRAMTLRDVRQASSRPPGPGAARSSRRSWHSGSTGRELLCSTSTGGRFQSRTGGASPCACTNVRRANLTI